MHVIAGGLHQHLAHVRSAQFQQLLAAADIDDGDMQVAQGFAQRLLGGELFAARDDQQPLVRAEPLQAGVALGNHGQRYGQLKAEGLVHASGEGRVMAIATNGQVTEQFLFTHGHTGVLAAFTHQAGEVGMVQRRLGLGPGSRALLVNVGCGHVKHLC